jgi:DNA repair protein RadC
MPVPGGGPQPVSREVGVAWTMREMEASQRPRERLLASGPAVLSDAELIAVLLRGRRRGHGVREAHLQLLDAGGRSTSRAWTQ